MGTVTPVTYGRSEPARVQPSRFLGAPPGCRRRHPAAQHAFPARPRAARPDGRRSSSPPRAARTGARWFAVPCRSRTTADDTVMQRQVPRQPLIHGRSQTFADHRAMGGSVDQLSVRGLLHQTLLGAVAERCRRGVVVRARGEYDDGWVVSQFRQPFQQLGAARLGETELDDRAVDSDQTIGGHLRQPGDAGVDRPVHRPDRHRRTAGPRSSGRRPRRWPAAGSAAARGSPSPRRVVVVRRT